MADIICKLGTSEFARCRIGIGHSDYGDTVDYVLDAPSRADRQLLDDAVARARDAVLCWVESGIETAMNRFNTSNE